MVFSLPKLGKCAIPTPHFPTRHQAFIFRACEYIPTEKIARILSTTVENVEHAMQDMGLPNYNPGNIWLQRGYITIIRSMWHILPYEQLLDLLETDEETLAVIMREEDFLDIKLSSKPLCNPVRWRELTDEEVIQTKRIKEWMRSLDFSGKKPFCFEYSVPKIEFTGEEVFSTRMIYAFSGLYQHAFDVDSQEYLPDEQLEAYKALGINGIWTQGVLSQLSPFPFEPTLSKGYEKRLERMRALTERLASYGIKLYLYLNEPRALPLAFFEKHPELKGHIFRDTDACLCTSLPEVQNYLKDAVESVCRAVPLIGGFFSITRSENLTNCYSYEIQTCNCPRCKEKSVGEVISQTIACFLDGARRVSEDIKVFAWSWRWDQHREEIIKQLPQGVILLSQSELDIPFCIGGIQGNVLDYSMSIPGPSELAQREWALAKERGLEIGAKVQVNTTWEASTVPAIPVTPSVSEHIRKLRDEGIQHLMLSWTLGGYPCRNIAAASRYFYKKCTLSDPDDLLLDAEKQFVEAFKNFPFHISGLYRGPHNAGPSTLLYETPTHYTATMTCYAYDDLTKWRSIYPADIYKSQFEKLCSEWEIGLKMIPEDNQSETATMARAAYCLFRASRNQIRFVMARDEKRYDEAVEIAKDELAVAKDMFALMNKNAAIGYEAANHYYFSKGQIAEKIINCQYIIDVFSKKQGETV